MTRETPKLLCLRFGAKLVKLRRARGLTQGQVEQMAGFQPGYLSRLENGLIDPGLDTVAKLATAYGLTISKLTAGID